MTLIVNSNKPQTHTHTQKTQLLNSNKVNHLTTQSLTGEYKMLSSVVLFVCLLVFQHVDHKKLSDFYLMKSLPYFYGFGSNHQKCCLIYLPSFYSI